MSDVVWKTLGEVITIYTGDQLNKNDMDENGLFPVMNGGTTYSGYTNNYNEEGNTVTISQGGASAGFVSWIANKFWLGAHCYAIKPKNSSTLLNRFLFHFIKNNEYNLMSQKQGAGIPGLNREAILKLPIQYISPKTQQHIADKLDTFTTLISRLESELELRQKQYEHYREELLNFEGDEEVEWKTINSVANNYTGLTYRPTDVVDSGVLVLRSSNIKDGALSFDDNVFVDEDMNIPDRALVKENDILICVRNGSKALVGKCALIPNLKAKVAFGAFMSILRAHSIHYKYLLYIWKSHLVQGQIKGDIGAPINQITSAHFKSISIPVPSKPRQQQIVEKLDAFEQLIAALKREIALRQKQYEYYREKLLTFE